MSEILIVDTEGVVSDFNINIDNITERLEETLIEGTENDDVIVGTNGNE